jgi:myo-inositol-1(or 4)-monophosphatase
MTASPTGRRGPEKHCWRAISSIDRHGRPGIRRADLCDDGRVTSETPAPEELLAIAVAIAADGAVLAREARSTAITQVRTKSTETDVVTAADHAVERLVLEALHTERPRDAVLTEEAGMVAGHGSDVRWILDPIDGTVNYLYGVPYYALSLAAEVSGTVVAGVVHNIATGTVYTATRGGGAWRDAHRLSGSAETELSQALVATGFAYRSDRRAHQSAVLAGLLASIRDIRRLGAGALDLCLAAEGAVDAYYEKGLSTWDLAAGALIASEAGLVVSGLDGRPAGPEFLLAAPPDLHAALVRVLADLDASGGP